MTWLFIRFYLSVLVVLFAAWYLHGWVTQERSKADLARVVTTAHAGGVRLVALELNAADSVEHREHRLAELRRKFEYPITVMRLDELPREVKTQFIEQRDIAFRNNSVYTKLGDGKHVVRMGRFPDHTVQEIEESLVGWMRLAKQLVDDEYPSERRRVLGELQREFEIGVDIANLDRIPGHARRRMLESRLGIAFYRAEGDKHYSAIGLADGTSAIRFGPYSSFEKIDQKAATTTLALIMLPVALAIALLLRPVQRQLLELEHAAESIASGDLSARVDQQRINSAKPLAHAFNHMASRTEALVRTQRELLQAVSHELRTPLSRMRFAIDLIGSAKDDRERKQRLESLDAATEELDDLVGELLSYVRLESAGSQSNIAEVGIRDTLDTVLPKYRTVYPDIEFAEATVSETVWADRNDLVRVLGNLIGNAGRFARTNVRVSAFEYQGMTVIDVDDDGVGIAKGERARVFEPFVRLDQRSGHGGGVGLGLAIVKRIVHQHGGMAEVMESPFGGCRMRTRWPKQQPSGD